MADKDENKRRCIDKWLALVKGNLRLLSCRKYIKPGKEKDLLTSYYRYFFPFEDICTWLSYGKFENLHRREFAYTHLYHYFTRYRSYVHFREMKFEISKVCPAKIDIGPICNVRPSSKRYQKSIPWPVEKELTFDIDLSDYNNVRTCCKDTGICPKCWRFVSVACKILDVSFREDFGWKQILWVFSGRRGIHCWVCDPDVRRMNNYKRRKIAKYYTLKRRGRSTTIPVELGKKEFTDHQITRSFEIAIQEFVPICIEEQNVLGTPEGVKQFISLLPTDSFKQEIKELFGHYSTSLERWETFDLYWNLEEESCSPLWQSRPHLMKEIVFYYLYPRIDVAVTQRLNHLLKAPFSFHPKTFLLSTPFNPKKVDEFIISEVPSLYEFIEAAEDHIQVQRYKESLSVFKNFVKSFDKPLDSFNN